MDPNILPSAHPNAWINLLRGYVTSIVCDLSRHGITVHRSWLDPTDPRDATILYTPPSGWARKQSAHALVWDEQTGWRTGQFVSGESGVRTVLSTPTYIGGGLLPTGGDVAWKIGSGATTMRRSFRSYGDIRDGLDDALRNQVHALV